MRKTGTRIANSKAKLPATVRIESQKRCDVCNSVTNDIESSPNIFYEAVKRNVCDDCLGDKTLFSRIERRTGHKVFGVTCQICGHVIEDMKKSVVSTTMREDFDPVRHYIMHKECRDNF